MSEIKKIRIAILGLGTVGTNIVKILQENAKEIMDKNNLSIEVSKIFVRNIDKLVRLNIDKSLYASSVEEIYNDDKIDIVVELIGGINPAKEYIEGALKAKKHVVSANKDLICMHGGYLAKVASENKKALFYEASCLSAIPIINVFRNNFQGEKILSIKGILNGTSNFILSKMKYENMSFDDALALAQELGYAESDPTNDISGLDAAYKLCILARLAFLVDAELPDVNITGIQDITAQDIEIANSLGYTIKSIGTGKYNAQNKLELRISPSLVSNAHYLSKIDNSLNSIIIKGSASDDITLAGEGAGGFAAAASVLNDIISCAGYDAINQNVFNEKNIAENWSARFFIRFKVSGDMASEISYFLKERGITIQAIININAQTIVVLTSETDFISMQNALSYIKKQKLINSVGCLMEIF